MTNRLAAETSPYLQQHKENPVDWWPWGEAAFAEARRRDTPVLLSIGYAACHWCQVTADMFRLSVQCIRDQVSEGVQRPDPAR